MVEAPLSGIPPEEVERRLSELAELYELGAALRDVKFPDEQVPGAVRERPDSAKSACDSQGERGNTSGDDPRSDSP
jgi:hypothetical protein